MTWNRALPQGNLPVARGADPIRQNWDWLEESLKAEHEFPGLTLTRGIHRMVEGGSPESDLFDGRINFASSPFSNKKNYIERYHGVMGIWDPYLSGEVGDIRISAENVQSGFNQVSNWLRCEGGILEVVKFPKLFEVIGNNFTETPAGGTFQLPDFRKRMPVGHTLADVDYNVTGKTGGSSLHQLVEAELPTGHTHGTPIKTDDPGTHFHNYLKLIGGAGDQDEGDDLDITDVELVSGAGGDHTHEVVIPPEGSDVEHENKPPFQILTFEILGDPNADAF